MKLSPRQREIANLIADGLEPEQVGQKLGVKAATVRSAVSRIVKKKKLGSKIDLVIYVWRKRMENSQSR